ncbi:hypothetical protein ON010_g1148 [Phytophthora cinnamomi]|nr:hypothetical protein ON010_g1148 [Phytophthora cinnamomi]
MVYWWIPRHGFTSVHAWMDSTSGVKFTMLAIPTAPFEDEVAYGECPSASQNGGYESQMIPCASTSILHLPRSMPEAKMTTVEGSGWVSRWLAENYSATATPASATTSSSTVIIDKLNGGGIGTIHELVAVKMLLPSTLRDMKLVNEFLAEAKLTATMDHPRIVAFIGIAWDSLSDLTMTAGVGTSLWMAPEVMTGEKYDDKADISHQTGDAAIVCGADDGCHPSTRVAMETISIKFSEAGLQLMLALGNACASTDPSKRPRAAEAQFRLDVIPSKEIV